MTSNVLITGASRGIGKHIALHLARAGHNVAVHCRQQIDAAYAVCDTVRAMGVSARALQFDVGDRERAAGLIEEDIKKHGPYYGVVCNAGVHKDTAFPAMEWEDWNHVIRTNLDGFYNVVHPVVMPMVRARKGGRIVVMSSLSGITGNRGQVNYSAAKGGLIAAAKALAVELAKRNITVNCIAPGFIETDLTNEVDVDRAMQMIPARRFGTPDEVASLVGYLFSDQAGYITRQVISVNGGIA